MPETRAQLNRKVRQDALREQLASQKHVEHVVEIVDEIKDPSIQIEQEMIARYKLVIDTKLKLINKYLPDLKSTEITGEGGEPLSIDIIHYAEINNTE